MAGEEGGRGGVGLVGQAGSTAIKSRKVTACKREGEIFHFLHVVKDLSV